MPSSLLVASAAILPWATSVRASSAGVRVVAGATGVERLRDGEHLGGSEVIDGESGHDAADVSDRCPEDQDTCR